MPESEAPAVPRPAATVMLVRDGADAVEVFMMKRNVGGAFAGLHVFPGGKVDATDHAEELEAICDGLTDAEASAILGVERGGLAYWVACIRECFEEAGVLLARDGQGNICDAGADGAELAQCRQQLRDNAMDMAQLAQRLGVTLAADALAYASHWITPAIEKRRFDTRFFVAKAPRQAASHDGEELVDSLWINPGKALEEHRLGALNLILPTIRNLEGIDGFATSAELLAEKAKNDADSVPTILPKFVKIDGTWQGLLPGDPGYDDH